MLTSLIIIFICSYVAFSISAICGGGASLMLIPILRALVPIAQVPAALSIGTFSSSASRILIFYKHISWNIVRFFAPAAIPAVWLGAYLIKFINPIYLEVAMSLFLISNLPFVFRKPKLIPNEKSPSNAVLSLIGFMAGCLSGLTGAVGLLFNKFYLRFGLSNEEIIATRAANDIILHLIKIVLYSLFGLISVKVMALGTAVALSAFLSSWSMKWILPKLSITVFKKTAYMAMVVSGVFMLVQSGNSLMDINKGNISSKLISEGIEAKLQWQNANYSMELTYDEGFEFEQIIHLKDLSFEQQEYVKGQHPEADKIILEVVYSTHKESYEAYYFKNNVLLEKIDF